MAKGQNNMIKFLYFTAEWCKPCVTQDPKFHELVGNESYKGKVDFKKIDVDEHVGLTKKYEIHAVPTMVIEKRGTVLKKYVGITQTIVLTDYLDSIV